MHNPKIGQLIIGENPMSDKQILFLIISKQPFGFAKFYVALDVDNNQMFNDFRVLTSDKIIT
jgi:hypothetical protein